MKTMSTCSAVLASCLLSVPSCAETASGADFLSGNWAIVDDRGVSDCDMPGAHGDEIGFEFARSGGRAVLYEVPDLFTVFGGLKVRVHGDDLIVTARTRFGRVKKFMKIRRLGTNEAEVLSTRNRPPDKLQRCAASGQSIAEGVSDANLFALSPTLTGGQGFLQVLSGETPADVCEGKVKPHDPDGQDRGSVQFELIGPSHFWALFFGDTVRTVYGYSTILSAQEIASDTVQISMRNWEGGAPVTLTIRVGADRIEIPELQATFARCRPDQSTSLGMHRTSWDP
jgi:hypothetical protein